MPKTEKEVARFDLDPRLMKSILGIMKDVTDEFLMKMDSDGIHIAAVDPFNIYMAFVDVVFHCDDDVKETYLPKIPISIGVDYSDWMRAIKLSSGTDIQVKILSRPGVADGSETVTAKLSYASSQIQIDSSITLLDPAVLRKPPKIPAIGFRNRLIVDSQELKAVIKAWHDECSEILLTLGTGILQLSFKDFATAKLKATVTGELSSAKSLFDSEILGYMVKQLGVGEVELFLGDDYPLTMNIIKGMGDWTMRISYLLAPRIHSE